MTTTISAPTPGELLENLALLASTVYHVFARFSLRVNFSKSKKEAIANFVGKGAKAVRTKLCVDLKGEIRFESEVEPLRVVQDYKHLGSYINASGGEAKEILHRRGSAGSARSTLSRRVFSLRKIRDVTNISLAMSLMLTRLLYNAQTWNPLKSMQNAKLSHEWLKAIRSISGDKCHAQTEQFVSDAAVLAKMRVPSVPLLMRQARLRYVARLLSGRSPKLLLALCQEAVRLKLPWAQQLFEDLDWALSHSELSEFPGPRV